MHPKTLIAHLRRLNRRQWTLLLLAAILALPLGLWLWRSRPRPVEKFWEPLLPYGALRVGIDPSYPPFAVYGAEGDIYGLDVDLAQAVAAVIGAEVRLVPQGYDGLYDSLKADQTDVLFSALVIDTLRLDVAQYSAPYFDAGQVLVRPPRSRLDSMQAMDGHTVAVEFGAEGDVEARRWQRRLRALAITLYDSPAAAIEAVARGEADAAVVDAISARLWLREHPDSPLRIAPDYVTGDPYAAAVRAGNDRLLDAVNAALERLREDGTLEAIINRWL